MAEEIKKDQTVEKAKNELNDEDLENVSGGGRRRGYRAVVKDTMNLDDNAKRIRKFQD